MSAPGALKTEREILSRFQELRSELDNLAARANNIAAELNEHDLVLKTLEPLDGGRKCYRLVGEVLVERTVAEVAPAVRSNRDQLDLVCPTEAVHNMQTLTKMLEQLEKRKKALADFQEQYKVRVKGEGPAEPAGGQAGTTNNRGVMV